VAKNNFLTDNLSTVGGLAAIAYGSSAYFQTVTDQVRQDSSTRELDYQLPSNALLDYTGTDKFVYDIFYAAVEEEYDSGTTLTDFVDINTSGEKEFSEKLLEIFLYNINRLSDYQDNYSSLVDEAIEETIYYFNRETDLEVNIDSLAQKIHNGFLNSEYLGRDIAKVVTLLIRNPKTKIASAPPDSIVSLYASPRQDKDFRGVDMYCGYLTKSQYYGNTGYVLKDGSIRKSVSEGYVGYPAVTLIGESLYNSDSSDNISLRDLSYSSESPFDSGVRFSETERRIYSINLASINTGN
tara:strand:- start:255 stop:1142 length:888 start_codon:yes stop_codon:yes gene_type:complete